MISIADRKHPAENDTAFISRIAGALTLEFVKRGHKGAELTECRYAQDDEGGADVCLVAKPGTRTITADDCRALIKEQRRKAA